MDLLLFLIAHARRNILIAIGCGWISGTMTACLLALINSAIYSRALALRSIGLAFALLCCLAMIGRVASELILLRLGQDAVLSMRIDLTQRVLNGPLVQIEEMGMHRLLSVFTDDIPNITNLVALIPSLCVNVGVVVSCLIYMGWLEWKLLLLVLAFMILGVGTYGLGIAQAMPHLTRARRLENEVHKQFQTLTRGIKELKLNRSRRNDFQSAVMTKAAGEARAANVRGMTIYTIVAGWGQFLVFAVIGVVMFWLSSALGATPPLLNGFVLALLFMMSPLQSIMNAVPGLSRANVAIVNVETLGLSLSKLAQAEDASSIERQHGVPASLKLNQVTYFYHDERGAREFMLGPIDLEIFPGELLFLTGGNGSGKTTLAKLILGLYRPHSGNLSFNGNRITDENRDSYRQLFSAVLSDFFLFESLLGLEPLDLDGRARAYLARLRLDHKVTIQSGRFSTTNLSQGERKRLALLVSCLEDRAVCFFDEWAADQDPSFKNVFYYELLPWLRENGKTVVVISHDDRYYGVADRIVTLEAGQIRQNWSSAGQKAYRGQKESVRAEG